MGITNVSLKEHFDEQIKALYNHIDLKIIAIEKSTTLAKESMERRLEGMNEFRDSLKDQSEKFVSASEYNIKISRIEEDIRLLRESKATLEGKASTTQVYIAYIIAAISIGISLLKYIL
jgi:hypothetical protein